jgi:hypothetical protein
MLIVCRRVLLLLLVVVVVAVAVAVVAVAVVVAVVACQAVVTVSEAGGVVICKSAHDTLPNGARAVFRLCCTVCGGDAAAAALSLFHLSLLVFSFVASIVCLCIASAEAGVQEWLCRLISVLASSDDPARAKRVADCGALDIVLAVMSRFGGAPGATVHEGALHGACLALSRLCTHEDVRERFMRASGVELLCATMERVEHNAGLAEMGCR